MDKITNKIKKYFKKIIIVSKKVKNYGQCYECKQPYTSEEDWCNNCDEKDYRNYINKIKTIGNLEFKLVSELSLNEKWRFKHFGLCYECGQTLIQGYSCIDCYYDTCHRCNQSYLRKYDSWCNDCDAKRFLDEGIEYCKKINELTNYEKWQFKTFGFCHNCKQLKIDKLCNVCNSLEFKKKYLIQKYGQCNECLQLYPPEYKNYGKYEMWCNNYDTKRFLEESKIIGYHKKPNELSMNEKLEFKKDGFCHGCGQIKEF